MMSDLELAGLIELDKVRISQYIAAEYLTRSLVCYADKTQAEIAELVLPTVEMAGRYLQSGSFSEYQTYIHELTLVQLQQGHDLQDFYAMGAALTNAVMRSLRMQLVDQPILLNEYQNRLRKLQFVTQKEARLV